MKKIDELLNELIENYDEETIAHDNAVELKQVLNSMFKEMLTSKDETDELMDNKIDCLEEIDKDDVYNGMMYLLNIMIAYMPWLQDAVNEHYESNESEA